MAGLWHATEQGGEAYGIREADLANHGRGSLWIINICGLGESLVNMFYTLSTLAQESEEGFAFPLSLTLGRLCHSHRSEALGSLT